MPRKGTIYRALIASPSDCKKERLAIPEIVYSWNSIHSINTNSIIEPVMWETHAIPELGNRPQEILNNQIVDSCDLLIGAFWTRIGTATGNYVSGTAEEIDRLRNQGKQIFLYFSSEPVVPESIDLEQYKALKEYKKRLRGQGITFDYSGISDFREMLQRHLSSYMSTITSTSIPTEGYESGEYTELQKFKSQFDAFLRKFETEWIAERDSNPLDIEEAKYIISSALHSLLGFRSQIVTDSENEFIPTLTKVSLLMKEMERQKLRLDGGESLREFWKKGNSIIESLKKLPLNE